MRAAEVAFARGPAWAGHAGHPPPTWVTIAVIVVTVMFALVWLWLVLMSRRHPPGRDGDDDRGAGPGGGGPRRPGPDDRDAPGGDPAWWDEFERQFSAYVAARELAVR
jgi:hypothetical protein